MSERVLIADPAIGSSSQLRRYLEGAGFRVSVAHFLDDALERLQMQPVDVFFAVASAEFDGETLCRRAKRMRPHCPVVLVYAQEEDDAEPHAAAALADGFLVEPLKKGTVVSCARAMIRLSQLHDAVEHLSVQLKRRVEAPRSDAKRAVGDLAFFKRFLLLEVKRSRRYRLPVSFLLVSLDGLKDARLGERERRLVPGLALAAVSRGLREIDLAVPMGEARTLVFLPHTSREGAITVAERIRHRMQKHKVLERLGVSVGVAAYDGKPGKTPVSLGALMRDATEALARAQAAGGDRVEVAGERPKREKIAFSL